MQSSTRNMSTSPDPKQNSSREHDFELELNATPGEVWAALTEAGEIIKWFAPEARVEPGAGGKIFISWGPGMEGASEIQVWEPGKHLKVLMPAGSPDEEPPRVQAVDYLIESREGKTYLRLVHSGFDSDAKWDNEYESTHSGWLTFLAMLRYSLEEQAGVPATTFYQNLFLNFTQAEIYERLTGENGLKLQASEWRDGAEFTADLGSTPIHGHFPRMIPGKSFILAAPELDGALLAFFAENFQGKGMLTVQAVLYGNHAGSRERVVNSLTGLCDSLFPEESRISF